MTPSVSTLPLLQLASGDRLSLQLYKFVGAQPGKKIYIQSNLHGAEIAGNAVIHQLITWLMTLEPVQVKGEIWLVPVCNPLGINQRSSHFSNGRFNPYDGKDWNRIFWDYEKETEDDILAFAKSHLESDPDAIQQAYRQAIATSFAQLTQEMQSSSGVPFNERYRYRLQSLCWDADYVIDLHTSADQGVEYLFYFRDRQESAALFLLPIGILLDKYDGDAFDEAFIKPWLALENCFATLGRSLQFDVEAWTLELGPAMQPQPASVAAGLRGVKNYLAQKGFVDAEGVPLPPQAMRLTSRSQVTKYYAPAGGIIQSRCPLGTEVKPGDRLYQLLSFNKEGKLPHWIDVHAETGGLVFDVSVNHAVNEGEYVLAVL